jgi:cyclopropane-fatty-acyl-phospholipid synthase
MVTHTEDTLSASSLKAQVTDLLATADVRVDGPRAWDIRVLNDELYGRVLRDASLGLGEAYMDGWWECDAIDEMICRLMQAKLHETVRGSPMLLWHMLLTHLGNPNSKSRAFEIGERHYDLGNDLYEAMLDPTMSYSCGYWKGAKDLGDAQLNKLELICRKIGLKSGQRVLDIGCGWGGFARYAAQVHGAIVTGVTVSKEQCELARKRCTGLPVEIVLQDYRDVTGGFDHVVSIGMFEHVGRKNYETFFEVARERLNDDGLLLLHTIGSRKASDGVDPWIDKYIFPNSHLPAIAEVAPAYEGRFVLEDLHNFGAMYETTLLAWHDNFERAWPGLAAKYGERFHRMWRYYLLSCAGLFRAREAQLWQMVFSKEGVPGGYESVR